MQTVVDHPFSLCALHCLVCLGFRKISQRAIAGEGSEESQAEGGCI